jgi:cytidylate kinase
LIVAVDGPVAAGKGTLARRLAQHFGFAYLDSGSLYRATALRLVRSGLDPANPGEAARAAARIDPEDLQNPDLRMEAVGAAASIVAQHREVRAALLAFQREFAHHPPGQAKGAVLDGRDIGTVVCPDADVKIFVTASPEVRASRRHLELSQSQAAQQFGRETPSFSKVLADLRERDLRDQTRSIAPLKPAADAHLLDATNLDIEAAFQAAQSIVAARIERA